MSILKITLYLLVNQISILIYKLWKTLVSMKTALVLLLLLAVAALPGTLLPQRTLNNAKVDKYVLSHKTLGPWLDRFEIFNVFSSTWFTSIYILLALSLVGCLMSRIKNYLSSSVFLTKNTLSIHPNSPVYWTIRMDTDLDKIIKKLIYKYYYWYKIFYKKYCLNTREILIFIEKIYLREFGNIVFHTSLLGFLTLSAIGKIFGYEGSVIAISDKNYDFCSTSPAAFDTFKTGNIIDNILLNPICIRVKDFNSNYLYTNQPLDFTANITYQIDKDLNLDLWHSYVLKVNHPLRLNGNRIYLQGHGYALMLSITDINNQKLNQIVELKPINHTTLLSSGTIYTYAPAKSSINYLEQSKYQFVFQGIFAPTKELKGVLLSSSFPLLNDPTVQVDIYCHNIDLNTKKSYSTFNLNSSLLNQNRLNKVAHINLKKSQEVSIKSENNSSFIIKFDKVTPFISLQFSHDPTQIWVLIFSILTIIGLSLSLIIRPYSIWIKINVVDLDLVEIKMCGVFCAKEPDFNKEIEKIISELIKNYYSLAIVKRRDSI